MTNIIADFPAYAIFAHEDRDYAAGEIVAIPFQTARYGTLYSFFTLGSVEAYAAQYNEDPAEAVRHASARGHQLFWLNKNATCLTAEKRAKTYHPHFDFGDEISFAGKRFVIKPDHNQNAKLVPSTAVEG